MNTSPVLGFVSSYITLVDINSFSCLNTNSSSLLRSKILHENTIFNKNSVTSLYYYSPSIFCKSLIIHKCSLSKMRGKY